jgi:hypothetical protein
MSGDVGDDHVGPGAGQVGKRNPSDHQRKQERDGRHRGDCPMLGPKPVDAPVNAIEGVTEKKCAGADERRAMDRRSPLIGSVVSLAHGTPDPGPRALQRRPHVLE